MTHLLLIFFVFSLLSGLVSLLLTGLAFFKSRCGDYIKRTALIVSFTLLVIVDTISFYTFNTGIELRLSWYMQLADIAIPCLVFSLPFFIHTVVDFPYSKIMNRVFLGLGVLTILLIILGQGFSFRHTYSFFFIGAGFILTLTILYSCILSIVGKKNNNRKKKMGLIFGFSGLILFPGFVLFDIFQNFQPTIAKGIPFVVLFVPLYYMLININFIIHDASFLLKTGQTANISSISVSVFEKFKLSSREQEVCRLLLSGKKYSEIADSLCISLSTVKTHINNIYEKCGVSGKIELINIFFS